jgi:hypothetical protein
MAAEKGITYDPAQTAAYVGSWINALKDIISGPLPQRLT